MPYGDGTGPYGTGPVGLRRGSCARAIQTNWPMWRGLRTQLTPSEELTNLEEDKKFAEGMLKNINQRLHELKK